MKSKLLEKIEHNVAGKLYRVIYNKAPKSYREFCENSFLYADIDIPEEIYFGFVVLYGVVLGVCGFFLSGVFPSISSLIAVLIGLGVFIVFEITAHYVIVLIGDKRARITEEILPDALKLMASNIRSGLTPDKALMLSARSEFGPLEVQIRKAAKMSLSGISLKESLEVIPRNINSDILRRTIKLISEGISKGGDFSRLLDSIADDISRIRILQKEVRAQVMMYSIFIFFAATMAAPVLYSVSGHLVGIMADFTEEIGIEEIPKTKIMTLELGDFNISKEFLKTYSLTSLVLTSIFGAFLMAILKGGSEKDGLKYIPLFLLVSMGVYFLSRMIIGKLFASLLPA
jgi:flagellar protein FlaJ